MASNEDYYAVLGVLPSIEQAALTAVYRALVKKYHPDVYAGDKAEAERITKEINAAYEILGDPTKRAEYDRERKASANESGDYEQESRTNKTNQSPHGEVLENWNYAAQYYPDAERLRKELNLFSSTLAFSFQVIILEQKAFSECVLLAGALKQEFLNRYFGSNLKIHSYVEDALKSNRRDVAIEVNKAIKILGSPNESEATNLISKISHKFSWVSHYSGETKIKDEIDPFRGTVYSQAGEATGPEIVVAVIFFFLLLFLWGKS